MVQPIEVTDYATLTRALAEALCPGGVEQGACHSCTDAAYRIVAKRKTVREMLVAFANVEAGLMPDPTAITASDLKTMVMQENGPKWCEVCRGWNDHTFEGHDEWAAIWQSAQEQGEVDE